MKKRIQRLAGVAMVSALGVTLTGPARAADDDTPACEYSVPRIPECLTLATYTYITGLEVRYDDAMMAVGRLQATNDDLVQQMHDQSLTIGPLRDRAQDAEARSAKRYFRIVALRAKVKVLRSLVRSMSSGRD